MSYINDALHIVDYCPCDDCDKQIGCKVFCKDFKKYVQTNSEYKRKDNLIQFKQKNSNNI